AGTLSRQEVQQELTPELVETPTVVETPMEATEALEPEMTNVARQETAPQLDPRETAETPLTASTPTANNLARRETRDAPSAETSAASRPSRAVASIDAPDEVREVIEALRSPTQARSLSPQVAGAERTVENSAAQRTAANDAS